MSHPSVMIVVGDAESTMRRLAVQDLEHEGDLGAGGGGAAAPTELVPRVIGRQPYDLNWRELVAAARLLGPDAALAELDDDAVGRQVREGAVAIAAATARWLALLAELVTRGIWAQDGATTPAQWLGWACGMGASTAREHVRVALRLRELPAIATAFGEGRVSYSKVRAITRVAEPDMQDMLLRWCDAAPASVIERTVATWRRQATTPDLSADQVTARRTVSRRGRDDGMVEVVVVVATEEADALMARLDRLVELEREAARAGRVERDADVDTHRGDVQTDGADRNAGGGRPGDGAKPIDRVGIDDQASTSDERDEGGPRGSQRVDALVNAVTQAVADGPADTSGMDRHTVVVTCRLNELTASAQAEPVAPPADAATMPEQPSVQQEMTPSSRASAEASSAVVHGDRQTSAGADVHDHGCAKGPPRSGGPSPLLRRLACDAGVVAIVEAAATDGSAVGSTARIRTPSPAMRRRLSVRDRHCRFPGCTATRHLHAHHIIHWADGGPTTMENLILLCGHHHRHVHSADITIRHDGRGRFAFDTGRDTTFDGPGWDASAGARSWSFIDDDEHRMAALRLQPRWWDGGRADHNAITYALHDAIDRLAPPAVDVLPTVTRLAA